MHRTRELERVSVSQSECDQVNGIKIGCLSLFSFFLQLHSLHYTESDHNVCAASQRYSLLRDHTEATDDTLITPVDLK